MFQLFTQTDCSSEQARYSKERKLGLTNLLPSEPFSQLQLVTSISLEASLAAATQLPSLMHFRAQHIQGDVAAQGHPSPSFQSSRKRDIFSPDWSCLRPPASVQDDSDIASSVSCAAEGEQESKEELSTRLRRNHLQPLTAPSTVSSLLVPFRFSKFTNLCLRPNSSNVSFVFCSSSSFNS